MKIRTIYFKVPDMGMAITFWEKLLGFPPHKKSNEWSEFKCENINLGFLHMSRFSVDADKSNMVPVFEVLPDMLEETKQRALDLGANIIVDVKNHPDGLSYVLADPFGNEFEVTKFHD